MTARDLGIYFPDVSATIIRYHIGQAVGPLSDQWSYYTDIDAFINSTHQRKVAFFQVPYPYNNSVEQSIDKIYDTVDAIVILGSELHPKIIDFIRRHDLPKLRWFVCGSLNPQPTQSQFYYFLDWFTTTVHFYKNVKPSVLYKLNPYSTKPLMFDALLGRKKPHRDQAYEYISNNLQNQGILTYINDIETNFNSADQSKWIWESEGLEGHQEVQWTVDRVSYYNHRMSLSQVLPINVYNQTAYSLVCETNFDNDYVFFTEKTVKPILARRLFVMIGHRYALATLRELGFRTFDGIIDESYDSVEPCQQRHAMALEQLNWLCQQNQEEILNRAREILEHNFDVMYGTDWYRLSSVPLSRILLKD